MTVRYPVPLELPAEPSQGVLRVVDDCPGLLVGDVLRACSTFQLKPGTAFDLFASAVPARCLFLARADFTPRLLPEETLRELRLGSRRHAADDGLRAQYYQDLEWQRAKRVYVKQVLSEARDRRAAERRKIGIW